MRPQVHCSSLQRIEACPGSLLASEGIESYDSDASISGTIIHGALDTWARGMEVPEDTLSERERSIYHWFRREVERVEEAHGGMAIRIPEMRLSLAGDGYDLVGRCDLVLIPQDGTVILIDYKTGYKPQDPASGNRQLMGYVCLLNANRPGWDHIQAHLFSAGDPQETRFTAAGYGPAEIEAANAYLDQIIKTALESGPRTPGDYCQYCPALGTKKCPETAKQVAKTASQIAKVSPSDVILSPARAAKIYDAIKAVEGYAATFLPALKSAIAENPDKWGKKFSLKTGSKTRSFRSVEEACSRLIDQEGIPPEKIWSVISLTPAKAEKLVKAVKSVDGMKAKDIPEYFASAFGDLIDENERAASIERVA